MKSEEKRCDTNILMGDMREPLDVAYMGGKGATTT